MVLRRQASSFSGLQPPLTKAAPQCHFRQAKKALIRPSREVAMGASKVVLSPTTNREGGSTTDPTWTSKAPNIMAFVPTQKGHYSRHIESPNRLHTKAPKNGGDFQKPGLSKSTGLPDPRSCGCTGLCRPPLKVVLGVRQRSHTHMCLYVCIYLYSSVCVHLQAQNLCVYVCMYIQPSWSICNMVFQGGFNFWKIP